MPWRAESEEAKLSVPPPPGPKPESRSGAWALYPEATRWSTTLSTQSLRPKISWMSPTATLPSPP